MPKINNKNIPKNNTTIDNFFRAENNTNINDNSTNNHVNINDNNAMEEDEENIIIPNNNETNNSLEIPIEPIEQIEQIEEYEVIACTFRNPEYKDIPDVINDIIIDISSKDKILTLPFIFYDKNETKIKKEWNEFSNIIKSTYSCKSEIKNVLKRVGSVAGISFFLINL